jgi:hypothetical protein
MSYVNFEIFGPGQISEHIQLGGTVYSTPEVLDVTHLCWKHLFNPLGPSTVIALRDDGGKLVGRSFMHPRKFWVSRSLECNAATVMDLVIAPEFRNAKNLISMTKSFKPVDRFDLVLHTSNETSDIIYRKLFKFPISFSLSAFGFPVRMTNVFKKIFSNIIFLKIADLIFFPWRYLLVLISTTICAIGSMRFSVRPSNSEVQDIFNSFQESAGPHFERGLDFLDWRFSKGNLFNANIEWVWIKNQCLGYMAFKHVIISEIQAFILMDVVLRRPLSRYEAIICKFLIIQKTIKNNCDVFFTLLNSKNSALKWVRGFPFALIPDALLPHETPIFIHASERFKDIAFREDIYFTLADLDYF